MSLQLPPLSFALLRTLVVTYNSTSENDPIQRLFYLQKINTELNKISLDAELFDWLYLTGPESWSAALHAHNINPDASFMLKSMLFAKAVAQHCPSSIQLPKELEHETEYQILQRRDALLSTTSFETCRVQYMLNCLELSRFAGNNTHMKALVERQTKILELSKAKFEAIRQHQTTPSGDSKPHHYKTKELSQGNNFNFKFTMEGWDRPFVFRVEDRENLDLEQKLHSYPVSKYFIEDFGVFMWGFEDKEKKEVVYKPVVLSQFANQGNLKEIAQSLKGTQPKHYAGIITHYFTQLIDLTKGLIDAGAYHPDIKLSNFLIHGNRLLMSDRKTLIPTENARVFELRSTPCYAPQEYLECITPAMQFNHRAYRTAINLPQFMAYQLGLALKEFITLTQREELDPIEFNDPNFSVSSYFDAPEKAMINLSTLIQELTREDATKRMSIKQMQELFKFRNHPPHVFMKEVERILPAKAIGIQEEVTELNKLIKSKVQGEELVKQANVVFNKLIEKEQQEGLEPRLQKLAARLAEKSFNTGSFAYFAKISKKIETALIDEDWKKAPFYRKALHILSFGLFRVHRYSSVNSIKIDLDFQSDEFQMHLVPLHFAPQSVLKGLGKNQAENLDMFLSNNENNIYPKEPLEDLQDNQESHIGSTEPIVDLQDNQVGRHQSQSHQVDETINFDSGTIKINKKEVKLVQGGSLFDDLDTGTVKINKKEGPNSHIHKKDSDTVEESSPSKNTVKKLFFFATKKKHSVDKFGTFRTTLFRGDATLTLNKAAGLPSIVEEEQVQPRL